MDIKKMCKAILFGLIAIFAYGVVLDIINNKILDESERIDKMLSEEIMFRNLDYYNLIQQ